MADPGTRRGTRLRKPTPKLAAAVAVLPKSGSAEHRNKKQSDQKSKIPPTNESSLDRKCPPTTPAIEQDLSTPAVLKATGLTANDTQSFQTRNTLRSLENLPQFDALSSSSRIATAADKAVPVVPVTPFPVTSVSAIATENASFRDRAVSRIGCTSPITCNVTSLNQITPPVESRPQASTDYIEDLSSLTNPIALSSVAAVVPTPVTKAAATATTVTCFVDGSPFQIQPAAQYQISAELLRSLFQETVTRPAEPVNVEVIPTSTIQTGPITDVETSIVAATDGRISAELTELNTNVPKIVSQIGHPITINTLRPLFEETVIKPESFLSAEQGAVGVTDQATPTNEQSSLSVTTVEQPGSSALKSVASIAQLLSDSDASLSTDADSEIGIEHPKQTAIASSVYVREFANLFISQPSCKNMPNEVCLQRLQL